MAQPVSKLQTLNLTNGELSPSFHSGTVDYNFHLDRKAVSSTLSVTAIPQFTGSIGVSSDGVTLDTFAYNNLRSVEVPVPIGRDTISLMAGLAQSSTDLRFYYIILRRPLIDGQKFVVRDVASPASVRAAPSLSGLSDGRVLLSGGVTLSSVVVADSEIYNPATDQWTTGPSDFGAYASVQQPLADGRVLLAGGLRSASSGPAAAGGTKIFNPTTGSWSDVPATFMAGYAAGSVSLDDGRVLVAGGLSTAPDGSAVARAPEIFNPLTELWASAGPSSMPFFQPALTKLADGRVLLSGGSPDRVTQSASAFIYDPVSTVWTQVAPMGAPRAGHVSSLLQDGRVLVSGGSDDTTSTTSEIYNPTTGTWSASIPHTGVGGGISNLGVPRQISLSNGGAVLIGRSPFGSVTQPYIQIFDPLTGTWSPGPFTANFHPLGATLLPGDRILIDGARGTVPNLVPAVQILEFVRARVSIMNGTGAVNPNSPVDVGATPLGVPRFKTLTLTNTGTTSIRLKTNDVEQSVAGEFTAGTGTTTLPAGATTTLTVTFTPAAGGSRTATLYVWTQTGEDNAILLPIRLEGRVGALTPYEAWAASVGFTGANSGPNETYRGDGVKNLLKFAFNTVTDRPDVSVMAMGGTGGLPRVSIAPGSPRKIRFEYVRRKSGAITYIPQIATTLTDFVPASATPVVTSIDSTWERVVIEQDASTMRAFGRVRVEIP